MQFHHTVELMQLATVNNETKRSNMRLDALPISLSLSTGIGEAHLRPVEYLSSSHVYSID